MRLAIMIIVLLISAQARGGDSAPEFHFIGAKDSASALSGECQFEGARRDKIECVFRQLMLIKPDVKTLDQALAEALQGSIKNWSTLAGAVRKNCKNLGRPAARDQEFLYAKISGVCNTKYPNDEALVRAFYGVLLDVENGRCKIATNEFTQQFRRAGNKWISDSTPKGICDVSNVSVLESEENGVLFTFTQTRMVVGNTQGVLCKGVEESVGKPVVFSWKYRDNYTIESCKSLAFGY